VWSPCSTSKTKRLREPRLSLLSRSEWNEEQAALLAPYHNENGILNIYTTVGRNPKARERF
jgi:hypothetical protein